MLAPLNFVYGPSKVNNMSTNTDSVSSQDPSSDRNVRTRRTNGYGLIPYDASINIPQSVVEVNIDYMLSESPERKCCIMYLQLIHVVSGSSAGQNNGSTYQSYYKKKNKDLSSSSQYYRLLLFRDLISLDGKVVYIVEGKHMNDKLWGRFPLLRDNGVVTIGTYIGVINPMPITQWFCNEIPILECRGGSFVMKTPGTVASIKIDMGVMRNTTRAFVLNNMEVEMSSMDVYNTKCSGLFCDRQRAVEIRRGNRACGCYSMQTRIGNIVLVHHVTVSKGNDVMLNMDDFSSLQFSHLYMKTGFTSSMRFNLLDYTPSYFSLQKAADDVVKYINDNGGFTIIGWYKRGEINDVSNDDSQNDVESSDIGYHIVSIFPTNRSVVNRMELKNKQFDIGGIVV